jgi:hypothetical protein
VNSWLVRLLELGVSIVELIPRKRKPAPKQRVYQSQDISDEELEKLLRDERDLQ